MHFLLLLVIIVLLIILLSRSNSKNNYADLKNSIDRLNDKITNLTIRIEALKKEKEASKAFIPATLRTIQPLAPKDAPVSRTVKLSVGPSLKNGMNFLVNDSTHVNDKPVRVGELQVWEVNNASLMDHPFHLHGFFFQVLEENGKVPEYMAWKDTYNLKPRTKIKIAWLPDNRPGIWMYHCHILEHHAAGMMANFEVIGEHEQLTDRMKAHSCHV